MQHVAYVVLGLCPTSRVTEARLLRPLYYSYRTLLQEDALQEGEEWNLVGRQWWLTWCQHTEFYLPGTIGGTAHGSIRTLDTDL